MEVVNFLCCEFSIIFKRIRTNVPETWFISFLLDEFILDQKSRASQVDCSKAGPGYSNMNADEIKRHKKFMPPGCSLVSGQDNFVYVFLLASFVLYQYLLTLTDTHTISAALA